MHDLLPLLGLAMLVFASTNIDDLFILLAFFADPRRPPAATVAGQMAGIAALYAASVAASRLALALPAAYVGLLGLVPLALGIKQLVELRRPGDDGDDAAGEIAAAARSGGHGSWALSVAAVTVANGGDNLGVYVPLFATLDGIGLAATGLVFMAMTALWCLAAARLTAHPQWGGPIRRYAPRLTPFVLIGLGLLILHESGTFALLGR